MKKKAPSFHIKPKPSSPLHSLGLRIKGRQARQRRVAAPPGLADEFISRKDRGAFLGLKLNQAKRIDKSIYRVDSDSSLFSHPSFQKLAVSPGCLAVFWKEGSLERMGKVPLEQRAGMGGKNPLSWLISFTTMRDFSLQLP